MTNINLAIIDANSLESFLYQYIEKISISKDRTIVFETGNYGMLLFNRIIHNHIEKQGWTITDQSFKVDTHEIQFVKYHMSNGMQIIINYKPELDIKDGIIDVNTGYPIQSETLYFKEIK